MAIIQTPGASISLNRGPGFQNLFRHGISRVCCLLEEMLAGDEECFFSQCLSHLTPQCYLIMVLVRYALWLGIPLNYQLLLALCCQAPEFKHKYKEEIGDGVSKFVAVKPPNGVCLLGCHAHFA